MTKTTPRTGTEFPIRVEPTPHGCLDIVVGRDDDPTYRNDRLRIPADHNATALAAAILEALGQPRCHIAVVADELGYVIDGIRRLPPPLPTTPGSLIRFVDDNVRPITASRVNGDWVDVQRFRVVQPEGDVEVLFDATRYADNLRRTARLYDVT